MAENTTIRWKGKARRVKSFSSSLDYRLEKLYANQNPLTHYLALTFNIFHAFRHQRTHSFPFNMPPRHRLRKSCPPRRCLERIYKVLRLMHDQLARKFHNGDRGRGRAVVGDDALAHPQIAMARDSLHCKGPLGRVSSALRGNGCATLETFA